MIWRNSVTEKLKIKYPVIQAPMLGVSTPEMVAAISNEGGLGSLPIGGLSPEVAEQLIRKTKSLTNKPFAVNLFAHEIPFCEEKDLEPMRQLLLQIAKKRGYKLNPEDLAGFKFYTYRDQIDVLVREEISIVSFTFGCLDKNTIKRLHSGNCTLIGTATCVEEAIVLQELNIDMIVAQGIEAGGHRGTFINHLPLPEIGLFTMLPQIINKIKIPCIAAGGINKAESIEAAFVLGAQAVQIGTAFIGSVESKAIASYKNKVEMAKDIDTKLTRAFSGRWARGLQNMMMSDIENSGIPIPPYPFQNSLTEKLRKLAQEAGDSEYTSLWCGQNNNIIKQKTSKDIFLSLIEEYENLQNKFKPGSRFLGS